MLRRHSRGFGNEALERNLWNGAFQCPRNAKATHEVQSFNQAMQVACCR
jgi:hypothetical protein